MAKGGAETVRRITTFLENHFLVAKEGLGQRYQMAHDYIGSVFRNFLERNLSAAEVAQTEYLVRIVLEKDTHERQYANLQEVMLAWDRSCSGLLPWVIFVVITTLSVLRASFPVDFWGDRLLLARREPLFDYYYLPCLFSLFTAALVVTLLSDSLYRSMGKLESPATRFLFALGPIPILAITVISFRYSWWWPILGGIGAAETAAKAFVLSSRYRGFPQVSRRLIQFGCMTAVNALVMVCPGIALVLSVKDSAPTEAFLYQNLLIQALYSVVMSGGLLYLVITNFTHSAASEYMSLRIRGEHSLLE